MENDNLKNESNNDNTLLSVRLCDGCNVRGNWEHRCHGVNCDCNNPVCMERHGKITHEQLMDIVNKALANK